MHGSDIFVWRGLDAKKILKRLSIGLRELRTMGIETANIISGFSMKRVLALSIIRKRQKVGLRLLHDKDMIWRSRSVRSIKFNREAQFLVISDLPDMEFGRFLKELIKEHLFGERL